MLYRFRCCRGPFASRQCQRRGVEPDEILRGRELRAVHALSCRNRKGGFVDAAAGLEQGPARAIEPGDARRIDLRAWAGSFESVDISHQIFSRRVSAEASCRVARERQVSDEVSNEQ